VPGQYKSKSVHTYKTFPIPVGNIYLSPAYASPPEDQSAIVIPIKAGHKMNTSLNLTFSKSTRLLALSLPVNPGLLYLSRIWFVPCAPRPRFELGAEIDFGAGVVNVSTERDVGVVRGAGGAVMNAYWAVSFGRSTTRKVGSGSGARFCAPLILFMVKWAVWLLLCEFVVIEYCVLNMESQSIEKKLKEWPFKTKNLERGAIC
jgi:hypothetical protein